MKSNLAFQMNLLNVERALKPGIAAVLGGLLLMSPGTLPGQNAEFGRRIYSENSASVLLLYIQSTTGEFVAQGSGFCVAGQKIITNAHVANAGKIFLELGAVRVPAHVEKVDSVDDLAVLTVAVEITAKPLRMAQKPPAPGDTVFAITNPEGLEKTISQGILSGLREADGRQLMQITAPISPGSSGGPVFNLAGEVVGVAVGALKEGQNLNFAVPIALARKLLESKNAVQGSGPLATLQEIDSLRAKRNKEVFSQDSDSPYQRKQAQLASLLKRAFAEAGNDPALLAQVSKEAMYDDSDLAILAAQPSVETKPSSETELILAKALNWKAVWAGGEEHEKLLRQAEKAARLAISATHTPPAEAYDTLAEGLGRRALLERVREILSTRSDCDPKVS